jgi:hypothetical protein
MTIEYTWNEKAMSDRTAQRGGAPDRVPSPVKPAPGDARVR